MTSDIGRLVKTCKICQTAKISKHPPIQRRHRLFTSSPWSIYADFFSFFLVERGNRDLGDALRSLLLWRDEKDWDLILPQTMRSLWAMPHGLTGEMPNYLMFGRELNLPDTLISEPFRTEVTREQYAMNLKEQMEKTYKNVREIQPQTRQKDD